MNTTLFRTKTEYIPVKNGHKNGVWEIAVDVGYSGVKVYSTNAISVFPSYAKKIDDDFAFLGETPENAIIYKNLDTGERWLVGMMAEDSISARDTSANDTSILYSRDRYDSPLFHVLVDTGLGIGCMSNDVLKFNREDRIVIQTGLPERYLMDDADIIKEVFCGRHHFSVKFGRRSAQTFDLTVLPNNVYVISQPKGTLFSVCMLENGTFHKDARKYLTSSVMVFDGGFGTLDIFPILSGSPVNGETYSDLGMRQVLEETSKRVREQLHVSIPVPAMQKCLETGTVRYTDRKNFTAKDYPFDTILDECCREVCERAIQRVNNALDLSEYSYIIVTGGTGEAWLPYIQERFKGLEGLSIIPGNQNDHRPFIYSNVRGYYYYRYASLK